MSERNIVSFLRRLSHQRELLDALKAKSKAEVLQAAERYGHPFTEQEYDRFVWDLEGRIAARRGEQFDPHFPLWETMWGRTYLEFLVLHLLPTITDADVEAVLASYASQGGSAGA